MRISDWSSDVCSSDLYQGFTNELNSVVVSNYAGFVGWIAGPLRTGMIIYIILLGYAIMRGAVQYPFREYVYRSLMLAALYYSVTNLNGASLAQSKIGRATCW